MAQISLHNYLQQIDTLLEENRLSEAIAHCRHILSKFPRYIEIYRLYGKALLEQQKYDDAVDIFQRVLSADPEDFISHVALAITHKEKEEVPEAIWHFERAFEMDPYNGAIQDELRGLYAHRDGLRPERINLTRGALARLYFRGNLYHQAAAELRQILSKNEARLDLQTLLAETLWRDDQRVDVVDVCLRILDKIPYCIKANAILAEVWLVTGRSDEAHEYLQRLRMLTRPEKAHLDPDSVVGRAFNANGVMELPDEVFIEELDYFPVAQELSGEADWVTELGIEAEEDEEANWLDEIEKVDAGVFAEAAASDADEDMLDWLREVAVSEEESQEETEEGATDLLSALEDEQPEEESFEGSQEDTFDWFSEGTDTSRESLTDVPDWLSEVTASAEADMWDLAIEANESQAETDEDDSEESAGGEKAQTPDWIREVAQENAGVDPTAAWQEEDQAEAYEEDDEIPDWMRGGGVDADEFPDWLNEPDETTTDSGEELPDWLAGPEEEAISEDEFPEPGVDEPVYDLTGEEIPDWLLGSDEAPDETAAPDIEDLSDAELDAIFEPDFDSELDLDSELDIDSELDFDSKLDFDIDESTDFDTADDDLPDWLTKAQEMELSDVEEEGLDEDIPDWLMEDVVSESEATPVDFTLDEIEVERDDEDDGGDMGEGFQEEFDETADWLHDFVDEEQFEEGLLEEGLPDEESLTEGPEDESIADEALPEWLEDSPELVGGQTDIDQDSLPDWLDGDDQEDMVREETLMGNSEEQENKEPDIPEDMDEAMKWLEELAAEQEADLEELPSMQEEKPTEETSAVEGDEVPDWLKADISDGDLSSEDDLPDWLKDEAASMAGSDWLNLSSEDDLSELEASAADYGDSESEDDVAQPSDDIPDWLKAQMPEDLQQEMSEAEDDDDLGWLDQIAAGEGAPIEELPTLSWDDDQDDAGFEGDDLSWLEELAEEDVVSEIEEPSSADVGSEQSEEAPTQAPDDPDEAMAWLEQLAAQQGASLDELPTMMDEEPADFEEVSLADVLDPSEVDQDAERVFDAPEETELEPASEFDVPDDPDEAMAWLEQLAAQQGASLDELPTVVDRESAEEADVIPEMDSSEIPTVVDLPEEPVAEAEAETETEGLDIPDDPDEAMAWLEQLAARQGASLDELPTVDKDVEVVEEMPTPVTGIVPEAEEIEIAVEEPEAKAESVVDSELEMALSELSDIDMPEDDDEALAWLEAIAGGETAEEMETAEAPETLFEAPDVFDEQTVVEPEPVAEDELFEAEESYPTQFETAEEPTEETVEEPEEASLFDAIEDETDQFIELEDDLSADIDKELQDEELASALPDWLQFGPVGETSREELDWLDSFGDSDVDSWLDAEEEVSQVGLTPEPPDTAELEPVAFLESEPEPEPSEELDEYAETTFEVESIPTGPIDASQLESARSALEIGDYDEALEQYNALLQSGQGLPLLIADLETASAEHTKVATLQRLLGDAYMQNGQLQKAIDTYRQALDNL